MMFRFAYPVLLFLIIVPAGWFIYAITRKPSTINYSITSGIMSVAGRLNSSFSIIPKILRLCCLMLLVLAAARPQFYNVSRDITSPGVDIMLALDTSGSMQALDFKLKDQPVTRLTAVKKVVSDFIEKREMDRIGLIVFGEEAFTQSPLTLDKGLLLGLVRDMEIGMAGDRTAIGSAIALGGKRLKDLDAKSKILIILTDGRQNAGDLTPEEAAEAARAMGIKIYTIGVGGTGPAPFKTQGFWGTRMIYQRVDLDEETLKKIARTGGGRYFKATDSDELSEIYDIINKEEKTEVKVKEFFHFRELYAYFLIPALLILALEIVLRVTALRSLP